MRVEQLAIGAVIGGQTDDLFAALAAAISGAVRRRNWLWLDMVASMESATSEGERSETPLKPYLSGSEFPRADA